MNVFTLPDIMSAATQAFVNARCRAAYLHDMRGDLQTLHSSVELLARAANKPGGEWVEKSSAIAKRAIATHERTLNDTFRLLTLDDGEASLVNLGLLLGDVTKLLRNDSASKPVSLELTIDETLIIHAQVGKSRLSLLGLTVALLDEVAPRTAVVIRAYRDGPLACIEFLVTLLQPPGGMKDLQLSPKEPVRSLELLMTFTSQWANAGGGELHVSSRGSSLTALRVRYPLARG